jgi:hypothetical protein
MRKTDWQPYSMPHSRDEAIDACRWLRDETGLEHLSQQTQFENALKQWCIPMAEVMSDLVEADATVEGEWVCAMMQTLDAEDEGDLKRKVREEFKWRRRAAADLEEGYAQDYTLQEYAVDWAQQVAKSYLETLWVAQYVIQLCADLPTPSPRVYYRQQFGPLAAQGTVVYVHDWAHEVPVNYLILKPGPAFRTEIIDAGDILGIL